MSVRVESDAIDELEHVNNAVYLQYVEIIARAHADYLGLTSARMIEVGGVFVVRRHEITYLAPAFANEELLLGTWIEKVGGPRCTRIVEIWRGEHRLVETVTEWVWLDPATRIPKRMPPYVAELFPVKA